MIFCRLHQWRWSCSHDEGRAVPLRTRLHVERCPHCAEVTASMARVDSRLPQCAPPPAEEWHESIMREVRRVSPAAPAHVPRVRPFSVALAAAAVICAALVIKQMNSPRFAPPLETSPSTESSIAAMVGELTGGSLERESAVLDRDALRAMELATSMLPF